MSKPNGYPTSIGSKTMSVVSKAGPASYLAGGFEVEARELGLKSIDFAGAMDSSSGVYFACPRIVATDQDATPRTSVFVQVYVASTGAQVANAVDLSGVTFRVWAVG
jgi:hypothetical protein